MPFPTYFTRHRGGGGGGLAEPQQLCTVDFSEDAQRARPLREAEAILQERDPKDLAPLAPRHAARRGGSHRPWLGLGLRLGLRSGLRSRLR